MKMAASSSSRSTTAAAATAATRPWRPASTTRRTFSRWWRRCSYVTGSHNMKFGFQDEFGQIDLYSQTVPASVDYYFINGVPNQVRQWATPIHTANRLSGEMGIYAQDAWTYKRATINMGLRYDNFRNSFPEQTLGPGLFVPTRNITFPETSFYNLKDLTPRIGVAYDLFGNGKTAVKAHWGKYISGLSAGTGNPVGNLSTNATRTWTDANGNFNVDCNLLSIAAQDLRATGGDFCGANPNSLFGLSTPSAAWDPEASTGWGNRLWNQTFSAGVNHEVAPGLGLDVTYYRRWVGNFSVIDNRAVTAADFTEYSMWPRPRSRARRFRCPMTRPAARRATSTTSIPTSSGRSTTTTRWRASSAISTSTGTAWISP